MLLKSYAYKIRKFQRIWRMKKRENIGGDSKHSGALLLNICLHVCTQQKKPTLLPVIIFISTFQHFPSLDQKVHDSVSLDYSITRSHFLRGWIPAKRPVLHDRPVDGKVGSMEIGFVHKSVASEAVKVGSISECKMIKTYILSPPYEVTRF